MPGAPAPRLPALPAQADGFCRALRMLEPGYFGPRGRLNSRRIPGSKKKKKNFPTPARVPGGGNAAARVSSWFSCCLARRRDSGCSPPFPAAQTPCARSPPPYQGLGHPHGPGVPWHDSSGSSAPRRAGLGGGLAVLPSCRLGDARQPRGSVHTLPPCSAVPGGERAERGRLPAPLPAAGAASVCFEARVPPARTFPGRAAGVCTGAGGTPRTPPGTKAGASRLPRTRLSRLERPGVPRWAPTRDRDTPCVTPRPSGLQGGAAGPPWWLWHVPGERGQRAQPPCGRQLGLKINPAELR